MDTGTEFFFCFLGGGWEAGGREIIGGVWKAGREKEGSGADITGLGPGIVAWNGCDCKADVEAVWKENVELPGSGMEGTGGADIGREDGINPSRSGWRVTVGCLVETVGGESSSSSSLSISKHVMLAAVLLTGRVLEGGWEDEKVMGWCAEKARGWREEKVAGGIVEVMEGGEELEGIPPHW